MNHHPQVIPKSQRQCRACMHARAFMKASSTQRSLQGVSFQSASPDPLSAHSRPGPNAHAFIVRHASSSASKLDEDEDDDVEDVGTTYKTSSCT